MLRWAHGKYGSAGCSNVQVQERQWTQVRNQMRGPRIGFGLEKRMARCAPAWQDLLRQRGARGCTGWLPSSVSMSCPAHHASACALSTSGGWKSRPSFGLKARNSPHFCSPAATRSSLPRQLATTCGEEGQQGRCWVPQQKGAAAGRRVPGARCCWPAQQHGLAPLRPAAGRPTAPPQSTALERDPSCRRAQLPGNTGSFQQTSKTDESFPSARQLEQTAPHLIVVLLPKVGHKPLALRLRRSQLALQGALELRGREAGRAGKGRRGRCRLAAAGGPAGGPPAGAAAAAGASRPAAGCRPRPANPCAPSGAPIRARQPTCSVRSKAATPSKPASRSMPA